MKKFLALALALLMCMSMFVACRKDAPKDPVDPVDPVDPSEPAEDAATLDDAVEYLNSTYKSDEGKKTPANYKLMAQVKIGDDKFPVTWTADLETITITLEDGLYTVAVPAKNDAELTYTLTATISDAAGKTAQKTYTRVLPVYDNTASVDELIEGEAYKFYLVQANLGLTLFATGETQQEKFIKTTLDPKAALDFYAEKVEGGYKFYTTIDGVKSYVHAYTTTDAETGKISKYICYAAETAAYYVYHEDVKAWFITIPTEVDGAAVDMDYVVGTYGTYETICISESSYITPENTGLTQFPVSFMLKADAEAMVPSERPEEPTDTISITEANTIGLAKEHNTFTVEKYLVKGTITEIKNAQYGNLYIADAEGNTLYVYGLYNADGSVRFDAMNPQPKVGDTITVSGILGQYNDAAQMKNGWVTELVAGEGGSEEPEEPVVPENKTASVAEAIAIGAAKEHNTYTAEKYIVTGVIDEIYNTQYGNMYIKDAEGNRLCIYGLYSTDGKTRFDAMTTQPAVGDTITVIGILGQYNSTPQMKSGWIYDPNASTEEPTTPALPTELTAITKANTIGAAKDHNTFTDDKYLVTGVITEVKNNVYGNVYIADAEGNTLYIYGMWNIDGTVRFDKMNPQPKVGDTVTVAGILGQYNDAPQMKNGWVVELVVGEGNEGSDEPETPVITELPAAGSQLSIPVANAIGASMDHNVYTDDKYTVIGKIVKIYNTQYGNMDIEDAEGNVLYVYGLYDDIGDLRFDKMDPQPKAGDTVTLLGIIGQYGGNPQMKNAWLIDLVEGTSFGSDEIVIPDSILDIQQDITNMIISGKAISVSSALALADGTEVQVKGVVTQINTAWSNQYGNITVTISDGSQTLQAYRLATKVSVGDEVIISGKMSTYSGKRQIAAGATANIMNGPATISIAEALEIGATYGHNSYSTDMYVVTGTITKIANTKYGNIYIEDAEGNELYLYGLYDHNAKRYDSMANKPQVGDTITVVSVLGQYSGSVQMKNAYLVD